MQYNFEIRDVCVIKQIYIKSDFQYELSLKYENLLNYDTC